MPNNVKALRPEQLAEAAAHGLTEAQAEMAARQGLEFAEYAAYARAGRRGDQAAAELERRAKARAEAEHARLVEQEKAKLAASA
jgi:hypothetical protein